ncbi:hypothetical protein OG311_08470 [Streptomyces sp. NBC_01343]|uniref:hypothetical protein n=1 Tax=Streptomyces sp. NBC_01343 TaxID=2903832 RepID=UPI002E11D5BB|nr:hypothetical protein OG311_08470 [Streptomyces sp. NBC_01343]
MPAVAAALLLLSGCHHGGVEAARPSAARLVAQVPPAGPGFPPDASTARERPARLTVEWGKNWETYKRENFGRYWSDDTDAVGGRNGCDTRGSGSRRARRTAASTPAATSGSRPSTGSP